MAEDNVYIIESLRDGIDVLQIMTDRMIPFDGLTLKEMTKLVQDHGMDASENKVFRILQTLASRGWVEIRQDKKYAVGQPLLQLSYRYVKTLYDQHEKIKMEINRFR